MLDQRRTIPTQCPLRVAVDDDGLKMGMGSVLIRMTGSALGAPRLAIEADAARCLALLSVAGRRRVQPSILRHIEAVSGYWQRGEKALANFRLLYAGLPHLDGTADAYRLRLAEYLLDEGTSPQTLMKELGLEAAKDELDKYSPDQPRVPAGNGRRSGEWASDGGSHYDAGAQHIVVAAEGDTPDNKNNSDDPAHQHHAGQLPEDEHGFQLNPLPGLPGPGGQPIPIGGEATSEGPTQSTVSGSRRAPLETPAGAPPVNNAGTFNGVPYSGHAFDQMQNRGIPPSVTDQAIRTGTPTPSQRYPGTTSFYDPENNVTVIRDEKTGKVITVHPGKNRP